MEERYVAFDVETPNAQNRRMSAIGVSVIENGQIVQELVNDRPDREQIESELF